MIYCTKCGTRSSDGDVFCRKCGLALNQETPISTLMIAQIPVSPDTVTVQTEPMPRTSGFAVTSLVLGIIAFIPPFFLSSILAIIFGGIAMGKTGRDPNLAGRGMAITGLVLGIIVVVIWVVLIFFLVRFAHPKIEFPSGGISI